MQRFCGADLRTLVLLLIIVLLLISFLVFLQRADCRTGAKPHGNAQHHAKTDVVRHDPKEDTKA